MNNKFIILSLLKFIMSYNRPIQLGLCCINTTLRAEKPPVYCSRTMIIRTINQEGGMDTLRERVTNNCLDLIKLIEWNEQNGIKVLRISSDMFPHYANPKTENYSMDFVKDILNKAGELAKKYNHRITMHPGQFNVVGSPSEIAFNSTVLDLSYQCEILDNINVGPDSVMVVHGGGLYGNKEETIKRWCVNFKRLPENVQKRLVLENCERCFSIEDCLRVSKEIGIPVVFDTHHYDCYNILHPDNQMQPPETYMQAILETWQKRGIKPKFHVSEQGSGRCGHHSDYIENIPDYLLEIPEKYNTNIDIMIEAKKKELAIFKLYNKYPQLNCKKRTFKITPEQKLKLLKKLKNI